MGYNSHTELIMVQRVRPCCNDSYFFLILEYILVATHITIAPYHHCRISSSHGPLTNSIHTDDWFWIGDHQTKRRV